MKTFAAYVEWDSESRLYVGIVPGVPGAHTQGATLDELNKNLKEVLELCLEEYKGSLDDLPRFVGIHQIEVAVLAGACRELQADGESAPSPGVPGGSTERQSRLLPSSRRQNNHLTQSTGKRLGSPPYPRDPSGD